MAKLKSIYNFFLTLWIGLVLGVSLFAAPIKFMVETMSRQSQLELGSLTFKYFNYIEWGVFVLILLIGLSLLAQLKRPKLTLALMVLLALILLADSFYILPVLHNYVADLSSGQASIESAGLIAPYHRLYVAGDFSKLVLSLVLLLISGLKK